MMEINLLNRAGAHLKEDNHFDNVDENLISEISLDFKKDFESIHEIKKAKIGTGKKRIFVYCFLIACIIGASFYYQYYINNKSFVDSENFSNLVEYIMEDDVLNLVNLKYSDYRFSIQIQVGSEFHQNEVNQDFKKHLNSLIESDSYSLEIRNDMKQDEKDILVIDFPPYLEIINSDESLEKYDFLLQEAAVSQDSLVLFIDNLLSSSNIVNFEIDKLESSDSYNFTILK